MSKVTVQELGVFDEVLVLLERVSLSQMAFDFLPTYPSLVIEFLATYCLRTHHINEHNPLYSMRFRLKGRKNFSLHKTLTLSLALQGVGIFK